MLIGKPYVGIARDIVEAARRRDAAERAFAKEGRSAVSCFKMVSSGGETISVVFRGTAWVRVWVPSLSNSRESPENLQADRLRIGLKALPGIWPERLRAIVPASLMEVHMRKVVRMVALGTTALAVVTVGGWSFSTTFVTRAANIDANYDNDPKRKLIGSYEVTGTDADGLSYNRAYVVDVSLAPSGALELNWDYGRQVGVGHVIDNVLAVATASRGRTVLLIMTINPDGSLAGRWSRRTDRGYQGTETWTRLGG